MAPTPGSSRTKYAHGQNRPVFAAWTMQMTSRSARTSRSGMAASSATHSTRHANLAVMGWCSADRCEALYRGINVDCSLRGALEMLREPREQATAVGRAKGRFYVVFRVRHHPEHVASLIEDAGDGVGRAVDVPLRIEAAVGRGVAEQHPALAFEPRDCCLVGDVIALAVRD